MLSSFLCRLSCHFLQLCHIDGIGICRTGRHTGDLAGDTFGRIAYGNSCLRRFPYRRCIRGIRTCSGIIARSALIHGSHRTCAKRHTAFFGHVGFTADGYSILDTGTGTVLRRTDDNAAVGTCQCSLIPKDNSAICIGHIIFGTDNGNMLYIGSFVFVTVQHIILADISACSS